MTVQGVRTCSVGRNLDTLHSVRFRYFTAKHFLTTNLCRVGDSTIVILFLIHGRASLETRSCQHGYW